MKGERKLSLVKPASPAPSVDLPEGEPPVTDEELREAEALRKALSHIGAPGRDKRALRPEPHQDDAPLATALRAAFEPAPIDDTDLDAILVRAMGDLDAPPTAVEQRDADRLRGALDDHDAQREGRVVAGPGARPAEDAETALAVALRAAWAPSAIGATRNDGLVSRSLATGAGASSSARTARPEPAARKAANDGGDAPAPISLRRFRLGPRTFATMTAVVAMAAGVLLLVGRLGQSNAPSPASVAQAPVSGERQARIASRSTTDLFDATTPFPRTGGESARVDRIATARASDLRANRFASWGVR
jgi:hypothetical protein